MKEFLVYTALRLGVFVSTFVVVLGIWGLLDDDVEVIWPLLIAVVVSALASVYLLKGPRERLAMKVSERAQRASTRFEEMRSKEDTD